jgi:hypothetical protein
MDSTLNQTSLSAMTKQIESLTKSGGKEAAKTATELADSVGSSALKELVKELTSDGKLDKADLNILKLFLDLLKSMGDKRQDSGASAVQPSTGSAAPASGGGGSQSPPSAGTQGGGAPAGSNAAGPASGEQSASGKVSNEGGCAGVGGKPSSDKAGNVGGSSSSGSEPASAKPSSEGGSSAPSGQRTYDDLKSSANSDGRISENERAALKNAAEVFGIKDASLDKKDMGRVLKDTMETALKDGSISDNEADAIASVATAAKGNSSLAAGEIQSMLSSFMRAAGKDNDFSNKDLATFNKLLSLVGGFSEAAASSGSSPSNAGPMSGGITASAMANYLFSPFMSQKDVSAIMAGVSGAGATGGIQTEEQKKANESKGA